MVDFMVQLFEYQIEYKLPGKIPQQRLERLRTLRGSTERARMQLETEFAERIISVGEFTLRSDLEAISFQKDAAGILNSDEYETLFDLKYREFVALADPAIVPQAYPQPAL